LRGATRPDPVFIPPGNSEEVGRVRFEAERLGEGERLAEGERAVPAVVVLLGVAEQRDRGGFAVQ